MLRLFTRYIFLCLLGETELFVQHFEEADDMKCEISKDEKLDFKDSSSLHLDCITRMYIYSMSEKAEETN